MQWNKRFFNADCIITTLWRYTAPSTLLFQGRRLGCSLVYQGWELNTGLSKPLYRGSKQLVSRRNNWAIRPLFEFKKIFNQFFQKCNMRRETHIKEWKGAYDTDTVVVSLLLLLPDLPRVCAAPHRYYDFILLLCVNIWSLNLHI